MDKQHVDSMLMNRLFNVYGTVLSAFDLLLGVLGFALVIMAAVNDANSEIAYDISHHYHFGMIFGGLVAMIAAYYGFTGFLSESVPKLILSPALMCAVCVLLTQSVVISIAYHKELSLLVNSSAEQSFVNYYANNNDSLARSGIQRVMDRYECCGWGDSDVVNGKLDGFYAGPMSPPLPKRRHSLPCICCDDFHKCNESVYNQNYTDNELCTNKSVDKYNKSVFKLKKVTCSQAMDAIMLIDLYTMDAVMIAMIIICFICIPLCYTLCQDLSIH